MQRSQVAAALETGCWSLRTGLEDEAEAEVEVELVRLRTWLAVVGLYCSVRLLHACAVLDCMSSTFTRRTSTGPVRQRPRFYLEPLMGRSVAVAAG